VDYFVLDPVALGGLGEEDASQIIELEEIEAGLEVGELPIPGQWRSKNWH